VSHHKQRASKDNGEQQHRWPAYNVNVARAQASIEGLFQHTRLIATIEAEQRTLRLAILTWTHAIEGGIHECKN
jgi:hypothetical protein